MKRMRDAHGGTVVTFGCGMGWRATASITNHTVLGEKEALHAQMGLLEFLGYYYLGNTTRGRGVATLLCKTCYNNSLPFLLALPFECHKSAPSVIAALVVWVFSYRVGGTA